MKYDALIVGAGPAGCAAAYDLAAAGRRVLLVDHRAFPRTKPCAGGITVKTLRRLRYSITPVMREICTDVVLGKRLEASKTLHGRDPLCAMTVRREFDAFCLERTVERGVDFAVLPRLDGIVERDDHVVVETRDGPLSAHYLIGADGANSAVRRLVPGLGPVERGFAIEGQVITDNPPAMEFDFGIVDFGYGWLFPKRDHVNVGLYTNTPTVRPSRAALAEYASAKTGFAELQHVVGHHIGLRGWDAELASARIALVGDAAGLVDPLLGEGIHNAVASGQAVAAAIHTSLQTGLGLRATYAHQLKPILRDVRVGYRDAARFYANVERGYRLLTSPVVHSGLMQGYARGLTHSATRRCFFLLPLLPVRPRNVLSQNAEHRSGRTRRRSRMRTSLSGHGIPGR
jgi:geranylgeranyl reductase family protein